jgi:uncharacterized membrane protein
MNTASRLWEIDGTRGVAIIMMVIFHTVFDLSFFSLYPVDVATGFWRYFAYATASLFLFVVGVSLVVSHARAAETLSGFRLMKKFLLRGAGIFALGLLVTLATWIYLGQGFVIFGILHLIGISVMLSPFFFRFRKFNFILGVLCILFGLFVVSGLGPVYLQAFGIEPAGSWSVGSTPLISWSTAGTIVSVILLPFGIHSPAFWSVDYTPLFPWFGMVLVGLGAGEYLYAGGVRQFSIRPLPEYISRPLTFLGRHSLVIYLLHQPVIILLLGLLTGTKVV